MQNLNIYTNIADRILERDLYTTPFKAAAAIYCAQWHSQTPLDKTGL